MDKQNDEQGAGNKEEFKINGEDLLKKVKELMAAGNARRIMIKNEAGEEILQIPLTWGAVGAIIMPSTCGSWCCSSTSYKMHYCSRKEMIFGTVIRFWYENKCRLKK